MTWFSEDEAYAQWVTETTCDPTTEEVAAMVEEDALGDLIELSLLPWAEATGFADADLDAELVAA